MDMKDKKIAVVVGGPSTEADVSRRTGAAIADALQQKGYTAHVLELVPKDFAADLKAGGYDVVFNALHGRYGEDGVLQGLCEMMNIPYTGPGVMASAVGLNKVLSKCAFQGAGIATAPFAYYFDSQTQDAIAADIMQRFSFPVVIKSSTQGSSIGTVIVTSEKEMHAEVVLANDAKNEPWQKPSSTAIPSSPKPSSTAMNSPSPSWTTWPSRSFRSFPARANTTTIPNTRQA